jgi:hypothetical protein
MATKLPLVLHISDFSWHAMSSLKADPEGRTCIKIAEEVVKELALGNDVRVPGQARGVARLSPAR